MKICSSRTNKNNFYFVYTISVSVLNKITFWQQKIFSWVVSKLCVQGRKENFLFSIFFIIEYPNKFLFINFYFPFIYTKYFKFFLKRKKNFYFLMNFTLFCFFVFSSYFNYRIGVCDSFHFYPIIFTVLLFFLP